MTDDKTLMKISLAVSIIGIIMLFAVAQVIEPKIVKINQINEAMIGQNIIVEGIAEKFSVNDGNIFIVLNDSTGRIDVVMFEQTARNQRDAYNLTENKRVSVTGKVNLYRTELEIVATSIKSL